MSGFPEPHNGGKASIRDDEITFTYITSFGEVITETKRLLDSGKIVNKIKDRTRRFKDAGPGSRESELSRAERKWIAAHPISILKQAWNLLDKDGKMEMSMMLDMNAHYGISDKKWAEEYVKERESIIGDNMIPLG